MIHLNLYTKQNRLTDTKNKLIANKGERWGRNKSGVCS